MLFNRPFLAPFAFALRNMRQRMGRTLLTGLGIALGVAVVLSIEITNVSTLDTINTVFNLAAGEANLLVSTDNLLAGMGETLPEELVDRMAAFEEVELATPTLRVNTLLASEASEWELEIGFTGAAAGTILQLYGVDVVRDPELRVYKFTAGRLPSPDAYEAVLPADYAAEKDLALGDDLVLLVPGSGVARLEVVGLLASEGVALFNNGVVAVAPLSVVQELFNHRGEIDEVGLKIVPAIASDPDALDALKDRLEERVGRNARVIYPAARGQLVSRMLASFQAGLQLFSGIAIFVGTFLIYNTFSMTVVERTREIGMMRAIGMNRWHVLGLVMVEASILAVAGSAVGLVFGVVQARALMLVTGAFLAAGDAVITVTPQALLQSLFVGIVITLGAALFPAYQATRISPLEALRARAQTGEKVRPAVWVTGLVMLALGLANIYVIPYRASVYFNILQGSVLLILAGATLTVPLVVKALEGAARPWVRRLYGGEGALGSANVQRSVGRTTLTVAAMIVALAMIVGIGSISISFEDDFTSWINASLGGDLYVTSPVKLRQSFLGQLATVEGVEAATPARFHIVQVAARSLPPETADDDDTVYFVAIEPETYRQVSSVEFTSNQGDPEANWQALAGGDAVFLSSQLAETYNLNQGDTIWLKTRRGEKPFRVAGVIVDFFAQGQTITGTYRDLGAYFSEDGADRITVKVAEGYTIDEVSQRIKDRYGEQRNLNVQTTTSFKAQIQGLLDQSLALFDVLSLIGVVIGSLGVVNTLTMNVIERRREIGGLRSLGMTRNQIVRMVLAEAFSLGLMGALYGLGFGFVLAQVMIQSMNSMSGYDLEFVFSPTPFLVGLALAAGISQLAALAPARRGAALNIVEAIKHE
ncbi:MAG: ABC transporter permease [Anaerolineae bacterium]|nr:MAG: ABC transporter permease [Anaerolineae bacterium]